MYVEWKSINGYEGLYEISNTGQVRNKRGRILVAHKSNNGYLHVSLSKNNIRKTKSIHKLVALHFIENINNLPQINHIDENKANNNVENLQWCTIQENIDHSFSKEVIQFDLLNNPIKTWKSASECGRNGFNQGKVSECCRGERETHKKYKWKYKEELINV